jgi:hypothetical protein
MTTILSEPPREITSLSEEVLLREYGDVRDVRLTFGLRETFTYQLWSKGKIKGVLVPAPTGGKRGKRLFSFASIRKFLADCEASGPQKALYYPRREKKATSSHPKEATPTNPSAFPKERPGDRAEVGR